MATERNDTIMKKPENWAKAAWGCCKGAWGENPQESMQKEREDAWKREDDLVAYVRRADAAACDDRRLAQLMSDMEKQFEIPALATNLPAWRERTKGAEDILAVYRKIAGMRS